MEFRWIAILTLWTLLAGPMFDSPLNSSKTLTNKAATVNKRPSTFSRDVQKSVGPRSAARRG